MMTEIQAGEIINLLYQIKFVLVVANVLLLWLCVLTAWKTK